MDVGQWYVRRGRISRQIFVCQYLLPLVLAIHLAGQADGALGLASGPLESVVDLAATVPFVAAVVTRVHDVGKSAWWLLCLLIPFFGVLLLFVVLLFAPGDRVPNRYGPPPAPLRRPRLPAALRRERPTAHDIDIEARPLQAERR